jgi:2-phospho-L-lactate guanylyltransferase (CobY/MobA/RfbA family)
VTSIIDVDDLDRTTQNLMAKHEAVSAAVHTVRGGTRAVIVLDGDLSVIIDQDCEKVVCGSYEFVRGFVADGYGDRLPMVPGL